METFRTSYRRDFGWPWPLPVVLSAWPPPERTFQRPRECPRAEAADCPCPEHDWDADRGGLLAGYMCLAGKEARLLQRSQAVRAEIQRCLNRTRVKRAKTLSKLIKPFRKKREKLDQWGGGKDRISGSKLLRISVHINDINSSMMVHVLMHRENQSVTIRHPVW